MSMNLFAVIASDDGQDCFGDYNNKSRLCARYCVLRLRCAIEQEQNLRSALLEELVSSENTMGKIQ